MHETIQNKDFQRNFENIEGGGREAARAATELPSGEFGRPILSTSSVNSCSLEEETLIPGYPERDLSWPWKL